MEEMMVVKRTGEIVPFDTQRIRDAIQKAQTAMFELMQGAMARMQQIIGKERWEQMQSFMGPGGMPGYGAGRGPGGMHRN